MQRLPRARQGRAGQGWGRFLSDPVHAALRAGKLKRLLPDEDAAPLTAQIVYPHAWLLPANLRVFLDHAMPPLRQRLAAMD
jgi:DNA-binding transcriptional LysR family regulator